MNLWFISNDKLLILKVVNFKNKLVKLQTVQKWNKSYIELIVLYEHPKKDNHAPGLVTVD